MPDATEPLRHELEIAAPPDVVFAYFTDPGRMVEWMGVGALLDPRPGGARRIDANGRDVVVGEYLELDPPRRLVFTWGFDGDGRATGAGSSRVEVVLEPEGGDSTRLTLSHHDLPPSARPSHAQGWEHYLERLGRAAAGDPPGRDPWLPAT
jgi:uncharacterized protein YndB with AHSA1/START domain